MIIIPAIDLKDGKCVRLKQGEMNSSTVFNDNPADQARQWQAQGASRIHVVDLDGSVGGRPLNSQRIEEIVDAVDVPVQLGGGVRDEEAIRAYLDMGVDTVILGTVSARNPDKVVGFISDFPGKIAIAMDARNGMIAVEGWTETTSLTATGLAERLAPAGPVCFIYTDISRDGMMKGPNFEATRDFARAVDTEVILSGGVSTIDDVGNALPLAEVGVTGIIIGRALYDGRIDLREAVKLAEG